MVCITLPTLFAASKTASKTFQTQVSVLERGADPGGAASDKTTPPWSFQVGPGGVTASGPLGDGITGSVSVGRDGVSGSASGGGAPAAGGASSPSTSQGAASPSNGGTGLTAAQAQQRLLEARTN